MSEFELVKHEKASQVTPKKKINAHKTNSLSPSHSTFS